MEERVEWSEQARQTVTVDGNEAVAGVAYALSEVIRLYEHWAALPPAAMNGGTP